MKKYIKCGRINHKDSAGNWYPDSNLEQQEKIDVLLNYGAEPDITYNLDTDHLDSIQGFYTYNDGRDHRYYIFDQHEEVQSAVVEILLDILNIEPEQVLVPYAKRTIGPTILNSTLAKFMDNAMFADILAEEVESDAEYKSIMGLYDNKAAWWFLDTYGISEAIANFGVDVIDVEELAKMICYYSKESDYFKYYLKLSDNAIGYLDDYIIINVD